MELKPIVTNLPDGTEVLLRPVGPEDKHLLAEGMAALSERSRRMRFLSATDRLSRAQLSYLTEIDQSDHQAWGILVGEEPIAVARLVRTGPLEAEAAITVADDWQRKGIGELLTRFLAHLARQVGIEELVFISLPENQAVTSLMSRFGVIGKHDQGLLTSKLPVAGVTPPHFLQTNS